MGQGPVGIQRLKRIVFDTSEIKFPVQKNSAGIIDFLLVFFAGTVRITAPYYYNHVQS